MSRLLRLDTSIRTISLPKPLRLTSSSSLLGRNINKYTTPTLSAGNNNNSKRAFSRLAAPSPLHLTQHSSTNTTTTTPRTRRSFPSTFRPRQFLRSCSHHRMCIRGADVEGSSLAQGREILPANVKPTNYKLELEPDFEKFTFDGKVDIELDVVEDTTEISVNTLDIKYHSVHLSTEGGETQESTKTSFDEDKQWATFTFDKSVSAGKKATLSIKFTGELNDKMAGFYRSSYKDTETGETRYLATTQMEPTDARRSFPCFDEPALKATYEVTLIADKKFTCLSNMDVKEEKTLDNGKQSVSFNKSPPMSTYLLAFIVGELDYIETDKFRLPVRVYATKGNAHLGQFSLDLAARTLEFYEKTFDSPYPLPKMDMVAIPDFSAGAMENWGLVTYRLVDLLFDETKSGAATKQRVAEVVQHELAHQWFGNLVTMDFWDGLWLNEGFATWMSWYSCNVFYPEWRVWDGYVTDNLQRALGLDSLRSSHPIEVPVKKADEINQIFDAISYSKGSCVLRMISKWIGEDVFMEGIRRYLKKHAYGNTVTGDLWAALSDASGKDVSKVMDIWTKKIGYPVVTVTEDGNKLNIKQNRFLRTADVTKEEDETLYPVFLALRTKDGVDSSLTLSKREDTVELKDADFYKINADSSGIYRTLYTPERLEKLGEASKSGLLTVQDRAGLIADAGALASSGYQKTSGLLALLKGFNEEKDFVVWDEICTRLASIRGAWLFEDDEVKAALKAFNRDLVAPYAHQVGWEFSDKDDHVMQQLKALLFGVTGLAGDEKIVAAAQDMFKKFVAGDKSAIHPNIRGSVYAIVLSNGDKSVWDQVLDAAHSASTADERNTALRALGRCKDPKAIEATLALSISKEVKEQDIYLPLSALRSHPAGVKALWAWAQENWGLLEKKLPPGLSMLGTVVQIVTGGFCHLKDIEEVEKYFGDRSTKGFERGLAQSLDGIRVKGRWVERDGGDVEGWLKSEGYLKK